MDNICKKALDFHIATPKTLYMHEGNVSRAIWVATMFQQYRLAGDL